MVGIDRISPDERNSYHRGCPYLRLFSDARNYSENLNVDTRQRLFPAFAGYFWHRGGVNATKG